MAVTETASIPKLQFIAERIAATNPFNCVPPTDLFSRNRGALLPNRICHFLGQIKIPTNTFIIGTFESKHRLGIGDIDRVFELAAFIESVSVVVSEYYRERLQFWKLICKGVGFDHALLLLFLIFRPWSRFS